MHKASRFRCVTCVATKVRHCQHRTMLHHTANTAPGCSTAHCGVTQSSPISDSALSDTYIFMYIDICVCVYICIYIYLYVYIHVYINI